MFLIPAFIPSPSQSVWQLGPVPLRAYAFFTLVGIFLVARIPWVVRGVGPDGALCDALATALMVDGRDAQRWMGRPELAEYSFWVINRDDETAWSYGSNNGY